MSVVSVHRFSRPAAVKNPRACSPSWVPRRSLSAAALERRKCEPLAGPHKVKKKKKKKKVFAAPAPAVAEHMQGPSQLTAISNFTEANENC